MWWIFLYIYQQSNTKLYQLKIGEVSLPVRKAAHPTFPAAQEGTAVLSSRCSNLISHGKLVSCGEWYQYYQPCLLEQNIYIIKSSAMVLC